MAMSMATAAMLGMSAINTVSSISAGNKQSKGLLQQGAFDAEVYEQQAGMIQEQKKLEQARFLRSSARMRGAVSARTAGKGLLLSGSPLAVMVDNETQMQFDNAINQYNLDVQGNYARSGANYSRLNAYNQAKVARQSGYSNAFSTILNTGTNFAIMGRKA